MSGYEELTSCRLCPRNCSINRNLGKKGFCGQNADLKAVRAALHMWEEPCISGKEGSGAIFFSGCSLGCIFCQNREMALFDKGKKFDDYRLTEIFWELKEKGANNINLVTPTSFVPQIRRAIERAKTEHFDLPFVYNTGSYEYADTIKKMEGLIDIYLPDFKFMSSEVSLRYTGTTDYPQTAKAALAEMVRQINTPIINDKTGMMEKGVIVRHLMLPQNRKDSMAVIEYLFHTYHNQIYISIMNQYTPVLQDERYPELQRKVSRISYERLVNYALELGVEQGFIQGGNTAEESYIPDFDGQGI